MLNIIDSLINTKNSEIKILIDALDIIKRLELENKEFNLKEMRKVCKALEYLEYAAVNYALNEKFKSNERQVNNKDVLSFIDDFCKENGLSINFFEFNTSVKNSQSNFNMIEIVENTLSKLHDTFCAKDIYDLAVKENPNLKYTTAMTSIRNIISKRFKYISTKKGVKYYSL